MIGAVNRIVYVVFRLALWTVVKLLHLFLLARATGSQCRQCGAFHVFLWEGFGWRPEGRRLDFFSLGYFQNVVCSWWLVQWILHQLWSNMSSNLALGTSCAGNQVHLRKGTSWTTVRIKPGARALSVHSRISDLTTQHPLTDTPCY